MKLLLTHRMKEYCETNQCYWFADIVRSYLSKLKESKETFAIAHLMIAPDNTGVFGLSHDTNEGIPDYQYARQNIAFTDHPIGCHKFYVVHEETNQCFVDSNSYMLILPDEY